MEHRFKYTFDRRTRRITAIIIVVIVAAFAAFTYWGGGSYLPAWFLSIAIAILALFILSIPRFVKVDEQSLEIHCLVELTRIHIGDLRAIRTVDKGQLKSAFPILGSYGLFGYYGYYFNFSSWEMVKVYAGEWANFVEIEDIYEQKYIISCDRADELIELVNALKANYVSEHTEQ